MIAGCPTPGGEGETPLSSVKAITAFSFVSPAAPGTIDENAKTIAVAVPYGTNVTALVATFTITGASVKVGSTVQVSGTTANDFSSPVSYTVTAADGSTASYTVTVAVAPSDAKAITAFSFVSPAATGAIDENAKTISVTVPYGTNVTALVATFTITGASVKVGSTLQVSGTTANDFSNPVSYMVTAADNSTANYTVTVMVAPDPSGRALWARTVSTGTYYSRFVSTTVDLSGNVYAAGSIFDTGIYTFGSGVTATGIYSGWNMVLVKYDSSGTALWARTVSTGTWESGFSSTAVDSNGNLYAAGYIYGTGTYTFGSGVTATGTYAGSVNVVLVKYDSSGTALWARTVSTGTASSYFSSTAVDSGGNVYSAGFVYGTGTYTFGGGVTAAGSGSNNNVVLVKYDSSGTALWTRTVSTGTYSLFSSTAVDSGGNVYAAGSIGTGTYAFGSGVTAARTGGLYGVVLVKYDSSGTALWARTVSTGTAGSGFSSTAVDLGGNVYAAGNIDGTETYTFGGGVTATGSGSTNVVLVKYDSSGTALWARTVSTGTDGSGFCSTSVDLGGNVYAAGRIWGTGTYTFESGVTAAGMYSGGHNMVLVKYDSSGTALWARTVSTGTASSYFSSTAVDSGGNVYSAGYIDGTGTYTFGSGVTAAGTNSGGSNVVLVKYSR